MYQGGVLSLITYTSKINVNKLFVKNKLYDMHTLRLEMDAISL